MKKFLEVERFFFHNESAVLWDVLHHLGMFWKMELDGKHNFVAFFVEKYNIVKRTRVGLVAHIDSQP